MAGNKIICSIRIAIPYDAIEILLVSGEGKKEAKNVITKKTSANTKHIQRCREMPVLRYQVDIVILEKNPKWLCYQKTQSFF